MNVIILFNDTKTCVLFYTDIIITYFIGYLQHTDVSICDLWVRINCKCSNCEYIYFNIY